MTTALHAAAESPAESMNLLRDMLEERFAVHTTRLTNLTVRRGLPGRSGYDAHTLELHAAAERRGIAETAGALRRMSEGTYGVCDGCDQPIPLGRLRTAPHATRCTPCEARR